MTPPLSQLYRIFISKGEQRWTKNGTKGFSHWRHCFYVTPDWLWQQFSWKLQRVTSPWDDHGRLISPSAPNGSLELLPTGISESKKLWLVLFKVGSIAMQVWIFEQASTFQTSPIGSSPVGYIRSIQQIWETFCMACEVNSIVCQSECGGGGCHLLYFLRTLRMHCLHLFWTTEPLLCTL